MLRFNKETDIERITRLEKLIRFDYTENNVAQDLLLSEADLLFMLDKAKEHVAGSREAPVANVADGVVNQTVDGISMIDQPNFEDDEAENELF